MKKKKKRPVKTSIKEPAKNIPKAPLKERILVNAGAIVIALACTVICALVAGRIRAENIGFEDRETLIHSYFEALDSVDKTALEQCFYPHRAESGQNISTQIAYAENEKKNNAVTWNPDGIQLEWVEIDAAAIQEIMDDITVEEAAQCVAFVPLEQKTADGITVKQEDVYEFFVHKTNGKWYVAAFRQDARNVTGAVRADGSEMTSEEVSEWLYSLAQEIGSDTVGYLFVDGYWSEVTDGGYQDDQIMTFLTADGASYMTMAIINDNDIPDFMEYSASIIKNSENDYGDILSSEGMIGEYKTDVQVAQNEETGAKIIVWVFKTDESDSYTHVITLESLSEYDASTYINTFHLEKQK